MDDQSLTDQLSFTGKSKSECQQFIREVRRLAFKAGKSRDDEWMADLAAASMMEDAIGWHVKLDDAVQGSWALLQKALAERYIDGPDNQSNSTLSLSSQVPAAARAETAASGPMPALIVPTRTTRTGNIALIDASSGVLDVPHTTWMARELSSLGILKWTSIKSETAVLRFSPPQSATGAPHDIRVVLGKGYSLLSTLVDFSYLPKNSTQSSAFLAFTSMEVGNHPNEKHASLHDAVLTLAASGFDPGSISSSLLWSEIGYTSSSIWSIDSQGVITAKVMGTPPRSEFVVNTQSANISSPISLPAWKLRFPITAPNMVTMKLVFVDI